MYLRGQSHTPAGEEAVGCLGGHHTELALVDERGQIVDLLLEGRLLFVLLGVRVRRLGARVCVGEAGRHLVVLELG